MIHITVSVKTDLEKAQNLSSAGIILRSVKDAQEVERSIGVFFGHCTNYNAYARAMLVAIVSIKHEVRIAEPIKFLFDKKTHISNILKSNRQDEVINDLKKHLIGVDIELNEKNKTDMEEKLLMRAATIANTCLAQKDSIV